MKKRGPSVPEQKGKIISNPSTIQQMPYVEKVKERAQQIKDIRKGQHTDLVTPRRGHK